MTTTTTTTTVTTTNQEGTLSSLEKVVLASLKAPSGTIIVKPVVLTQGVVWRQAKMWFVFFDSLEGGLKKEMLTRSSGGPGQLIEDFCTCGALVNTVPSLTNRYGKVPEIDGTTRAEIEALSLSFSDLARFFMTFNFTAFPTAQAACEALLENCESILEVSQLRIDNLNAAFIKRGGGNERKFLAAKCLDKGEFPYGDRDALQKAMTVRERFTAGEDSDEDSGRRRKFQRAQGPSTGGAAQQSKTCHFKFKAPHARAGQECNASFLGSHKAHCKLAGHPTK